MILQWYNTHNCLCRYMHIYGRFAYLSVYKTYWFTSLRPTHCCEKSDSLIALVGISSRSPCSHKSGWNNAAATFILLDGPMLRIFSLPTCICMPSENAIWMFWICSADLTPCIMRPLAKVYIILKSTWNCLSRNRFIEYIIFMSKRNGRLDPFTVPNNMLRLKTTWWCHQMKTSAALLALCEEIHWSPVNFPHKGQWRGALTFFFNMGLNKRLSKSSRRW